MEAKAFDSTIAYYEPRTSRSDFANHVRRETGLPSLHISPIRPIDIIVVTADRRLYR